MLWIDKVKRLMDGRSYAAIERSAGWAENSLSTTLSRGNMPGADKAVRLSTALGVPAEWLFDDKADWPPPQPIGMNTASMMLEMGMALIRAAEGAAGYESDLGRELHRRVFGGQASPPEKHPASPRRKAGGNK